MLNTLEILNSIPNNYHFLKRYYKFILNCDIANSAKTKEELGYSEKHHILPTSMFPEYKSFSKYPSNKAILTYRQHIIAHVLLMKVYPNDVKMVYALNMMLTSSIGNRKIPLSIDIRYKEKIKELVSLVMTKRTHSVKTKQKISNSAKGKNKGKPSPYKGKTHTDESKLAMSTVKLGKIASDTTRAKMSESKSGENNPRYGKSVSEETRIKISNSNKGKKRSKECRLNNSKAQTGKKLTEETKNKMSLSRIGKKLSIETKNKISAAKTKYKVDTFDDSKV